jgi:3-methyladenine DNA glycosylase AlkD
MMLATEILSNLAALPNHETATVRALRQDYSKQIKGWSAEEVLVLANRLLDEADFNAHFIAFELLAHHRPTLRSLGQRDLEHIGRVIRDWWSVDTFASYLTGVAWREGQIGDEVIHGWAHSPNRWWRRTALVSTIPLNTKARGGKGDVPRTLEVCALLVNDHDDMIEKAMSWALRELVPYDVPAIEAFIQTHQAVLGKRILREVRNKLNTGLKTPRKSESSL